jgi:hypothetical protein
MKVAHSTRSSVASRWSGGEGPEIVGQYEEGRAGDRQEKQGRLRVASVGKREAAAPPAFDEKNRDEKECLDTREYRHAKTQARQSGPQADSSEG